MEKLRFFFSLSILTDHYEFQKKVEAEGLPFFDLQSFDWDALSEAILGLLVDQVPANLRNKITIDIWPDSLESASKPALSETQLTEYLATVISGLRTNNHSVGTTRTRYMLTDYAQSAPPNDFNFCIDISGVGNRGLEVMESLFDSIAGHFSYGKGLKGQAYMVKMGMSEQVGHLPQKMSPALLDIFRTSFGNPFDNDISLLVMNENQAIQIEEYARSL